MILHLAALSSADTNSIADNFVASLSPVAAVADTFLFNVFKRVFICRFRAVWVAVFLMFFVADLVFAIVKKCGTHHDEMGSFIVKG